MALKSFADLGIMVGLSPNFGQQFYTSLRLNREITKFLRLSLNRDARCQQLSEGGSRQLPSGAQAALWETAKTNLDMASPKRVPPIAGLPWRRIH